MELGAASHRDSHCELVVIRTAIIMSSIILFVTWYVHVVNRSASGSDVRPRRLLQDLAFTASVAVALFVPLATWSLVAAYVWHVRGQPVASAGVLGRPLLVWTSFSVVGFAVGVVLAEVYCLADRRAFERESRRFLARAARDAAMQEEQHYARGRWWPASREQLVSSDR